MRSPLPALEAFSRDVQAVMTHQHGDSPTLASWLAVAKAAERASALPVTDRAPYIASLSSSILPAVTVRPTLVHDALPAPVDPIARIAERLRLEAEEMERAGCFELAYTTVSAVCRLTSQSDRITRMLATAHLGRIARQLDDKVTANDCYVTVVNEASRERDGPLEALGLLGLAILARMRGNRPEERRIYLRALACAYPGGTTERSTHLGLMNVATSEQRLADALLHGWHAFDLAPEGSEFRAMVLSNLALVAFKAGFHRPALQGFLHALTLTSVIRLRLGSFGGAVRAAAGLDERRLLATLDAEAVGEADRANIPFEVATFFANVTEAWCMISDPQMAERRLLRLEVLVHDHQFHELAMRAETLRNALASLNPSVAVAATSEWTDADAEGNDIVLTGIGRLQDLPA